MNGQSACKGLLIFIDYWNKFDYYLVIKSARVIKMANGTPSKVRITKRAVDACEVKDKPYFVWDDEITGFGVKINPTGRKTYVFQYRVAAPGKSAQTPARRFTIGKHGNVTPDQARQRAGELSMQVQFQNIDPIEQEREEFAERERVVKAKADKARLDTELAFSNYADRWLAHYETHGGKREGGAVRPASVRQAKLVVNTFLKPMLAAKPMPQINKRDIQAIIQAIPAEQVGMRRAVFSYASILFGWAVRQDDISVNFLRDMEKPSAPAARKRALNDEELLAVWNASAVLTQPFSSFYRMLILTIQRRGEVSAMEWSELNREERQWLIPESKTKNKRAHLVALSDLTVAELDRLAGGEEWPEAGLVFTTNNVTPISGISKSKVALDKEINQRLGEAGPMPHWRIHDLRRTGVTELQKLGVRFEVTEAVVNHVGESKSGIAGVYQTYDWLPEKRAALLAWGSRVEAIISGKAKSNVVELRPATNSA